MPDELMEREVNKNLVKYAVGRAIFCPDCEVVLDYRRAVLITGVGKAGISCTKCWDKRKAALIKKHGDEWTAAILGELDVLDGRVLIQAVN